MNENNLDRNYLLMAYGALNVSGQAKDLVKMIESYFLKIEIIELKPPLYLKDEKALGAE